MNLAVKIEVIKDTARPAVQALLAKLTPQRLAAAIGPAVNNLVKTNYAKQPPNKNHWPSQGFWADAARCTDWTAVADGVVITTDKVGVQQHYLGGEIEAGRGISSKTGAPTKYLAIAARAEAYGVAPGAMTDLIPVFGQRDGHAGTVGLAKAQQPKDILYWLVQRVYQAANPRVLPTDAEFAQTIAQALNLLTQ